jgi:elongation factor Ts
MSDYSPSAQEVKVLREATSAGMMDCKRALVETTGDHDAAVTLLRERGIAKQASRADRSTKEGVIDAYVHGGGRIGVLVEIGCETDFVAGTDEFKSFAHEIALQISASSDARWVSREDVPAEIIESELDIYRAQAADKPENVRDKIAQGKLGKWLSTVCLLEQPYVRDSDRTVDDLRTEIAAKTGENVQIKRFTRYERGA